MEEVREFKVREDVLATTIKYLGQQPHDTVAQLVAALKMSKPVELKGDKDEKTNTK